MSLSYPAIAARDLDETAASVDRLHAGDGDAWRRFATPYLEHFGAWRDTMLGGFPPVSGSVKLLAALRLRLSSLSPYRTPIRGLFLGSAATFPGGAVRCTACPATRQPAQRSPRRGSAGRCPSACGRRRFYASAFLACARSCAAARRVSSFTAFRRILEMCICE